MLIGLIALFAGSYLVKKSHEQNRISTPNSQVVPHELENRKEQIEHGQSAHEDKCGKEAAQ